MQENVKPINITLMYKQYYPCTGPMQPPISEKFVPAFLDENICAAV